MSDSNYTTTFNMVLPKKKKKKGRIRCILRYKSTFF